MMLSPRSYLFTRTQKPITQEKSLSPSPVMRRKSSKVEARDLAVAAKAASSEPVVIPSSRSHRDSSRHIHATHTETAHAARRSSSQSTKRSRNVHSPDAIPPAVAALLAMTTIPPPKSHGSTRSRRRSSQQRMTVDEILFQQGESEKELSMALGRSPLDLLLSPPDEDDDLETLCSESAHDTDVLHSTMSSDSIPSLVHGSVGSPSPGSVRTPSLRGRKSLPYRRLESLSSDLADSSPNHPLSLDDLDRNGFNDEAIHFQIPARKELPKPAAGNSPPPSGFKSNLTASLRALKSAARTITNLKPPLITPDDFLTRSIISPTESPIPFSEDRMPPLLEDVPTPALRRYLNPTTNAPIDAHVPSVGMQTYPINSKCSASIQMRTYRISRSGKSTSVSVISRRTVATAVDEVAEVATGPVARQRDVRENSDFIRIAVMEMAMRRSGKLDEKLPGRAKWCLPPRKPATTPYEITASGVPARWIAMTA